MLYHAFAMSIVIDQARHPKRTAKQRRQTRYGLLFLSPWIIGFILFAAVPMAYSLRYSFMSYSIIAPDNAQFIGLANYLRILDDPIAMRSIRLTALYVIIWTPISVLVPLGFATLLHSKHLFASRWFRLAFYIPTLVSEFAVAFIIRSFFSTQGWFYKLFLNPLGWNEALGQNTIIGVVIVSTGLWGVGNIILILLAARQGVPKEQYEAADVDGAGWFAKYRNITLPFMSPIIFYSLIISMVTAFQIFAAPFLLGGTSYSYDENPPGMFMTLYIFRQQTINQDIGYASALGWVLVLMAAVAAAILFYSARYWVFYEDEA